ncbi:uncharacterized protein LOC106670419 isoform X1 [Cimex lectularius]|uniref:Odorant receptor n=1 Tax=Cimex lectularius TaxID=79782 RepID=A0A8I6S4X0_CIMLE|nr:uncharacterized protein LOC106670419 isoform X1 [Cimex lectularius]
MIFKPELSSIVSLMKLASIRNDKSDKPIIRFLIMFRHIFEVVLTIGTAISCYVAGWKNNIGLVMFYSIIGTIACVQSIYFLYNYETGKLIFHDLKMLMKIQELDRTQDMLHNETDFTWKWIQMYSFNLIAFMILYSSSPILVEFILFILKIEVAPFLPPLPLNGFIVGTERHTILYFCVCFASIYWSVSGMLAAIGNQSVPAIYLSYHSLGITVLLEKMKKLKRKIDLRSMHFRDTVDEKVAVRELIHLIQEHKLLLRLTHNINLYCGFPLAVQNIMISGCVCLLAYAFLTEINTDISAMLVNAFCLVLMFLIAGIPCILGQRVETLSYQLCDGLYDLPWYKQSPHLRKYLNMALRQANKGMKIHYHGRSPLNHNTLINILNTSYSYFMVLQSSL